MHRMVPKPLLRSITMRRFSRKPMICVAFLSMALLVVCWVNCRVPPFSLDKWNIAELVEHLNRAGVEVRAVAVQKEGPREQSAYLTTTGQDWHYLNRLFKDAKRIHEWRGIVYCERRPPNAPQLVVPDCEPYILEVGPFFFFGDADLLARIGTALGQPGFDPRSDASDVLAPQLLRLDCSA